MDKEDQFDGILKSLSRDENFKILLPSKICPCEYASYLHIHNSLNLEWWG